MIKEAFNRLIGKDPFSTKAMIEAEDIYRNAINSAPFPEQPIESKSVQTGRKKKDFDKNVERRKKLILHFERLNLLFNKHQINPEEWFQIGNNSKFSIFIDGDNNKPDSITIIEKSKTIDESYFTKCTLFYNGDADYWFKRENDGAINYSTDGSIQGNNSKEPEMVIEEVKRLTNKVVKALDKKSKPTKNVLFERVKEFAKTKTPLTLFYD